MIAVVKAIGATVANGALQLVYQDAQGILRDISAGGYSIWDGDFTAQIYPAVPVPGGQQALAVTGVNHVGIGRYNAAWDSSTATVGRFGIRWTLTPNLGDPEITFDQEFELVTTAYKGPHYCTISDLRDEGLASAVTDAQAQSRIVRASRYVEFFTGRSFVPSYQVIELDGTGARGLLLNDAIVAIEKVVETFDSIFNSTDQEIDPGSFKIYNRHLTEGLVSPDDRDSPKIEFIHGDDVWGLSGGSVFQDRVIWTKGVRNIQLTGFFGYTERDGSFTGRTPELVREATKMLVFENLATLASGGSNPTGPVIRERTRDQEVQFAPLRVTGLSGNRSIDVLLAGFRRPPSFAKS